MNSFKSLWNLDLECKMVHFKTTGLKAKFYEKIQEKICTFYNIQLWNETEHTNITNLLKSSIYCDFYCKSFPPPNPYHFQVVAKYPENKSVFCTTHQMVHKDALIFPSSGHKKITIVINKKYKNKQTFIST